MCNIFAIIVQVFIFVGQAHDNQAVTKDYSDAQDAMDQLVDKLVDNLVDWMCKPWPVNPADHDNATLGFAIRHSTVPKTHRYTSPALQYRVVSGAPMAGLERSNALGSFGAPLAWGSIITRRTQRGNQKAQALSEADNVALSDVLRDGGQPNWDEPKAVGLVRDLAARGALRAFGRGRKIAKQVYSLDDLRSNKINAEALLSPDDTQILKGERLLQAALFASWVGVTVADGGIGGKSLGFLLLIIFTITYDLIGSNGGVWFLAVDSLARLPLPFLPGQRYARRVALHEAGHFLVAYLLGILPKDYTLSALDVFRRYNTFSIQAGCAFCDRDFQREMSTNRMSAKTLDVYTCLALAGVAVEFVEFGQAEGGKNDIAQLDGLLGALGFSQRKAADQVRWAVANTVFLIRDHQGALRALADAMQSGKPVKDLIDVVEAKVNEQKLGEEQTGDGAVGTGPEGTGVPLGPSGS